MKENYLKNELYDLIKNDTSIFEFIQSGSLDGIWYWDLEHIENEWMSPKFWEVLGFDPNERKHLSSEWQDIIFQDDLKIATENFVKHCEDSRFPYDQTVRYRHKSGSTVWIRCRGLAIRDENGKAIRMLGAHSDITELKNTEMEILRLTKEYEIVFNGTQEAMLLVEVLGMDKFRYIRNNIAHQSKVGIPLEKLINKSPHELYGKRIGDLAVKNYQFCVDSKKCVTYEEEQNFHGEKRIWLTTLTPIMEGDGVTYIVGSATDITERKKMELVLEEYANYDMLTGLPNRRLFFERLERIVVESERDETKFALLFIDLDGFKDINDQFGHVVGDQVLVSIGNRLSKSIRKSDSVARIGGDEFTVIIRKTDDKKNLDRLVKKIHDLLQEVIYIDTIECKVNSSIGIAIYPDHGKDSESLLKNADSTMYETKRKGKGGFNFSQNTVTSVN